MDLHIEICPSSAILCTSLHGPNLASGPSSRPDFPMFPCFFHSDSSHSGLPDIQVGTERELFQDYKNTRLHFRSINYSEEHFLLEEEEERKTSSPLEYKLPHSRAGRYLLLSLSPSIIVLGITRTDRKPIQVHGRQAMATDPPNGAYPASVGKMTHNLQLGVSKNQVSGVKTKITDSVLCEMCLPS